MPALEQIKQTDWFKGRPKIIKDLICQFPYAALVRIKSTTQLAYIYSWFENGTVKVMVTEKDNLHIKNALPGDYFVFGLKPQNLEFIRENPELILDE